VSVWCRFVLLVTRDFPAKSERNQYKLSAARLQPACARGQGELSAWSYEFSCAPSVPQPCGCLRLPSRRRLAKVCLRSCHVKFETPAFFTASSNQWRAPSRRSPPRPTKIGPSGTIGIGPWPIPCWRSRSKAERTCAFKGMCRPWPLLLCGFRRSFRARFTQDQSIRRYCSLRRMPVFGAMINSSICSGQSCGGLRRHGSNPRQHLIRQHRAHRK